MENYSKLPIRFINSEGQFWKGKRKFLKKKENSLEKKKERSTKKTIGYKVYVKA